MSEHLLTKSVFTALSRRDACSRIAGSVALTAISSFLSPAAGNAHVSPDSPYSGDKEKRRKELYSLLGDLPDRNRPITVQKISEEKTEKYILEKLVLDLNGIEPVPAYFVRPLDARGRTPVILYNHAHFGEYDMGKNEFVLGRFEMQKPPYAEELTRRGYSALCIDAWAFGERRGRTESEIFKQMLWTGQVMWGMMVYDNIRALDYLVSRDDIDSKRIGTMGMSMGSTMSWWLAALDTRIKVCVDICCLTDFDALIEARGLDGHGIYYYVPSLLRHFTTSQINGLISPRPHLGVAGRYDSLTPVRGLERIDRDMKEVYRRDNAPEAWKLTVYDIAHFEPATMRKEIVEFLGKWM
ncbi:dienelactone hydrolase family protein [bacterium]|nr:dienelactone hydrolase family protein [bacterium]